jgi:hypothetical protein
MRSRSESNLDGLASDVHFLTAPFRFMWHMVIWAVFLLLAPFIFIAVLVFGLPYMSADEISVLKVLEVVVGPFGFVIWWIIITHFAERRRARRLMQERGDDESNYTDAELQFCESVGKPHHLRTFGVLLVSFAGSVFTAYLLHAAGDQQFLVVVLLGICTPALVSLLWGGLKWLLIGEER